MTTCSSPGRPASARARPATAQLLARPVAAQGLVFTMDAEGTISAFDARNRQPRMALRARRSQRRGRVRRRPRLRRRLAVRHLELGHRDRAERHERQRGMEPPAAAAVARRADGVRWPPAGGERRQPALRPGRRDRPAAVAAHRLLRGRRAARRPEPGGRRQRRGRALFVRRGVRAAARHRPRPCGTTRCSARGAPSALPRSTTSTPCR